MYVEYFVCTRYQLLVLTLLGPRYGDLTNDRCGLLKLPGRACNNKY